MTRPFCILPWIHSHVDGEGHRKLCCISEPYSPEERNTVDQLTIEEYASFLATYRQEMSKGNIPDICRRCSPGEDQEIFKDQINEKLYEYYEEVISEKDSFKPLYLDYRIDNTCNLGCITCSPHLSSSIEVKARKAGIPLPDKQQQDHTLKKYGDELKSIINNLKKGFLYFANGEPFLSLHHWDIIEKLISDDKASSFQLKYNSNLSIDHYRGRNLEDFLLKFRDVTIYPSLDSWGEPGEFIRRGLKNTHWLKNFKKLKELGLMGEGKINVVLSIPAIINLPEFLDFLKELNHEYILSPVMGFGHEVLLNPSSLDKETIQNIISSFPEGFNIPKEVAHIKVNETPAQESLKDAIEYYYLLDKQYPEAKVLDYYSKTPLIKKWFLNNLKTLYTSSKNLPIRYSRSLPIEIISDVYNQEGKKVFLFVHDQHDNIQPLPIHQLSQLFNHFSLEFVQVSQSPLRKFLKSLVRKGIEIKSESKEALNLQKVIEDYGLTKEIEYLPPQMTNIFKKKNLFSLFVFKVIQVLTFLNPSLTAFKCTIRVSN